MSMAFRNIETDPAAPVETWPYEGLVTAIERGGLVEWRRIAAAIRRDPWGRVARSVEDYAGYAEPTGGLAVLTRAVSRARAAAEDSERASVAREVRELVSASGLSRTEFAAAVGTSPSRLSTYCTGTVTPSAALMVRMRRIATPANET